MMVLAKKKLKVNKKLKVLVLLCPSSLLLVKLNVAIPNYAAFGKAGV